MVRDRWRKQYELRYNRMRGVSYMSDEFQYKEFKKKLAEEGRSIASFFHDKVVDLINQEEDIDILNPVKPKVRVVYLPKTVYAVFDKKLKQLKLSKASVLRKWIEDYLAS